MPPKERIILIRLVAQEKYELRTEEFLKRLVMVVLWHRIVHDIDKKIIINLCVINFTQRFLIGSALFIY